MAEAAAVESVSVETAKELLGAGHKYLDVRTPEEFAGGSVPGAINIPYMKKGESGLVKNPTFIEEVASSFNKDDNILVACQSGKRSMMASKELVAAEYKGIIDVGGGYAAWLEKFPRPGKVSLI